MSVDSAVMDAPASAASDPVESANLPDEAKEVIRSLDAERPEVSDEATKPAEERPAIDPDAKPAPVEKPPVKLSDDQKRRILETKFSEEDVADLTPEQVDLLLSKVQRRDMRLIRQAQAMQRARDAMGRFQPAPQPAPAPAPTAPQRQLVKGVSEGGEYDDDIAKIINSQFGEIDELKKHIADFNQFKTAQTQQWEQREIEQRNAWFDDQFSKLGDAFHPVFGKGKIHDLLPESAEFQSRDEVASMFHMLERLNPNASRDELFQKAAKACHPDIYINQHRADLNRQVQSQSARRLGTNSSVSQPFAEPEEHPEAKAYFEKALRDNGSR